MVTINYIDVNVIPCDDIYKSIIADSRSSTITRKKRKKSALSEISSNKNKQAEHKKGKKNKQVKKWHSPYKFHK